MLIPCKLKFKHYYKLTDKIIINSQSNKNWIIKLYAVNDITSLIIICANQTFYFSFPINKCTQIHNINVIENKSFSIPYITMYNIKQNEMAFKLCDKAYSNSYNNGLFIFENALKEGYNQWNI